MNYTKSFLAFAILISQSLLFSCNKKAKINAEKPDEEVSSSTFVNGTSTINIPIILSIPELEKTANNLMTGVIYKDESYTNNDNDDLKLIVKKNQNITISAKGNELFYDVPLNIWVKVRKQILGIELSEDTEFDAIMKFKTQLDVTTDWDFKTKTTSEGYKLLSAPTIKLGPLEIPITTIVKSTLDDQLDGITAILDEQVQEQINLKKIIQDNWVLIQKPVLLDEEFNTWLRVQPKQFTMSPITGDKQSISFNIGTTSIIDVFSGKEPQYTINKKIPKLVIEQKPSNSFHVSLSSEISYDQANELLSKALVGFTYKHKKKEIEISKAKVFGNGDKLVLEIHTIGDIEGQMFFSGKPAYDSTTKTMYIDNLDYDIKTKKAVLKAATWLLKGTFKNKLEKYLRISLQEEIDNVTEMVQKSLKENSISSDMEIDLNIEKVSPKSIFIYDKTMRILIDIDGDTKVIYGK